MMISTRHSSLLAVLLLGAATSCAARTPEAFCEGWAEDSCHALSECCEKGDSFDEQGCRISLSQVCQDRTKVEEVHAGQLVFDPGAAADCLGAIESCQGLSAIAVDPSKAATSFERAQACANMLTGFRPPGAACQRSEECRRSGAYTTCHDRGSGVGVCAEVVVDDEACGFSFESGELRVCADGMRCDDSGSDAFESDPPSVRTFAFTGKCVAYVAKGGDCFKRPCAEGLYCDHHGGGAPTCRAPKGEGEKCSGPGECADGLACAPGPSGAALVCQGGKGSALYCFSP